MNVTEKYANVKHDGRRTTDSQIPKSWMQQLKPLSVHRKCNCTTYVLTKSESNVEITKSKWCLEKNNHTKLGEEKNLLLSKKKKN